MTAYDMICTQSRHAWFRLCNPNCSGLIYTVNESRLLSVLKGDFFPQILLMGGAPRWSAASHAGIICNKSQFTDPLTPRTLTSRKLHPRNGRADNSISQSSPKIPSALLPHWPLSQAPTSLHCCLALHNKKQRNTSSLLKFLKAQMIPEAWTTNQMHTYTYVLRGWCMEIVFYIFIELFR